MNTMQPIVFVMRYLESGERLVQSLLNSFFHLKCSFIVVILITENVTMEWCCEIK